MGINTMPQETAGHILRQFSGLAAPVSAGQYQALAEQWSWRTSAEIPDDTIIAIGPWLTGGKIHVSLNEGFVEYMGVAVSNSADRSDEAKAATAAVYDATLTQATAILGQPTGATGGADPRTWWEIHDGAIAVDRLGLAVIITWATPEHHKNLLASMRTR